MTINRNNFEAYLLDYLEGNLDPLLTADLMVFLAENPEFEKYLPQAEAHTLSSDSLQFEHKNLLKKDFTDIPVITSGNFDEFCIAACEGLLTSSDTDRLNTYLEKHPEKQKDFDIYRKLRLQPDLSIRFAGKSGLKRKIVGTAGLRYLFYGLGIAASVAFIAFLTFNKSTPDIPDIRPAAATMAESKETAPVPAQIDKGPADPIKNKTIHKNDDHQINNDVYSIPEETGFRETEPLATLDPIITASIKSVEADRSLKLPVLLTDQKTSLAAPTEKTATGQGESLSLISFLAEKIDLWKTAEKAIDGINYLTESQLSLSKTTDDSGNLTGLLLNTESYSITGNKTK